MSTRRGNDAPVTGGHAPSSTEAPGSRAEPGSGGPVLSTGPEPSSATGPGSGSRARPPAPAPTGPALRVVLVSRDNMLTGALRSLIEAPGGVRVLDWHSDELDSAIRYADVVVVDMPPNLHQRTFAVIDGRFLGRTVVLLQEGEHPEALPPGPPRAILYRPLQIGELWGAVTGALPAMSAAPEVAAAEVEPRVEEPEVEVPEEDEPSPGTGIEQAPVTEGQGLPVAESGRLIGLSGQELEPVIGPGQVAPGMDEETLEQLRRWGHRGRQPTTGGSRAAAEKRRAPADSAEAARADRATVGRARAAEARREQSRQAQAEARRTAAEASQQAKATRAAERTAAHEAARQAKAAQEAEKAAAREAAREAKAAEAAAKAAREAELAAAREEERKAKEAREAELAAARAAERAAARAAARQAKAARAAELAVAREAARKARAEDAEARKVARAAQAEQRRVARDEARRQRQASAAARRAERAEARRVARERSRQAKAVRAAARRAARAEAAQARAAQEEQRRAAKAEAARARAAQAEQRQAARAEAGRDRAAQAQVRREAARQARAARAEARKEAHAEAARQRAARAAALKVAREEARAEAARQRAARAEARRARAVRAEERRAERAQARPEVRPGTRQVTWPEARQVPRQGTWAGATYAPDRPGMIGGQARRRATHRPAALGTSPLTDRLLAAARPTLVVLALAAVGLAAAGWRGGGGPDTVAGEVAAVRSAGGSEGGLVVQDPRVGPIAPLHALVVGAWLRVTEARGSLEGVIREARGPSRVVLAGVVGLTVLLFLLLMRVGPGSGAAAGPGPAPPQGRRRRWQLSGAALAGALVALDPLLVRSGRAATGTILAVALALGALALAWGLPARAALRWAPLVGAVGGLALLVSPLAVPVLAVPVVAELLEGRHREAWRGMAALGLAVGVWLLLPIWAAGQGLDPGQVGWLLGRPPGRGPLAAGLASEPLSWLLVAAGLAATLLTWRLRSGARLEAGLGAARLAAWAATTAAGALVAIALGYPAFQALAFAIPAAAVSLAVACLTAATGARRAPRWIAAVTGVALAGLLVAQGLSWGTRYGQPADDGLGRLVATVAGQVPACSAVNAAGPDDRARLLAAGVTVTEYSSGPAALAAGVRYFALTGATAEGGPQTRSLAAWVRQHGSRLADLPSPSLSGIELWRVEAAPLDPAADIVPIPGGIFSNVTGSACGGYRVVDSQLGAFHTGYRAAGGKAVLGRPLGTVWTSDGPALQAFDTMVLGASPSASGPPGVQPIELPPLLAKLDVEAVADADIPLPSVRPPVTDRQARALLDDRLIARAYLGTSPGSASAGDWRRARERFGRPLGRAQIMPDGAVRQPFERAVLELPADGGPVRPAALGRLAARLGLVPRQAMRPEPVPGLAGLPARPAEVRLDPGQLLRPLGVALALLALAAAVGAVADRRTRGRRAETARPGR